MRAPVYKPAFTPVQAYRARFAAPGGPTLANRIGQVLTTGAGDLNQFGDLRSSLSSLTDDTAGRMRALQDHAAMAAVADTHAGLVGGAAVAAQPDALDALQQIREAGQTSLGAPAMTSAYDQQIGPALDDAANRITHHALQQAGVERLAMADQAMQAAQQRAAVAWQDPAQFVRGLGAVSALASAQVGPHASDTDRMAAVRSATGGAVAQAIGQALTAGEPEFAAHLMGGWGDTLSPAAYQLAIARLDQAAHNQRMATVFNEAAGGNPRGDAADPPLSAQAAGAVAIAAPVGAAVHPIAGGTVTGLAGLPDNASVRIQHPDGSSTVYGGLGLAAVKPGDIVAPTHVLGSASPVVTVAAASPKGDPSDTAGLLSNAGGVGAVIGGASTPRVWDTQAMLDRIAQRSELAPADQALAADFARQRMAADHARQADSDLSAGRAVVDLFARTPAGISQAADLPVDLAAQMSPSMLAQVDGALRGTAQAAAGPTRDNGAALRLELLQRHSPVDFSRINLAPLIGSIHPVDLTQFATTQAQMTDQLPMDDPGDRRSAVLDALARHEFTTGASLPDEVLPAIASQAQTAMRLNRTDISDLAAIDSTVANAIQSRGDRP